MANTGIYCMQTLLLFTNINFFFNPKNKTKQKKNINFFHVQKLQSEQQAEWCTALARLEESRSFLVKIITEHPGKTLDVIQETLALLRNEINAITQNSTNPVTKKANEAKQDPTIYTTKRTTGIISFLDSCFKVLSFPLNLPIASGKIARFAITAAIMVSVIHFHQMSHQHIIKRNEIINQTSTYDGKKDNLHMNPTGEGEIGFFQCISRSYLDVSNGRGWHPYAEISMHADGSSASWDIFRLHCYTPYEEIDCAYLKLLLVDKENKEKRKRKVNELRRYSQFVELGLFGWNNVNQGNGMISMITLVLETSYARCH